MTTLRVLRACMTLLVSLSFLGGAVVWERALAPGMEISPLAVLWMTIGIVVAALAFAQYLDATHMLG